jgi:hypothetical protein
MEDHVSAFFEFAGEYAPVKPWSSYMSNEPGRSVMAKVFGRDPPAELIEVRAIVLGLVSSRVLS